MFDAASALFGRSLSLSLSLSLSQSGSSTLSVVLTCLQSNCRFLLPSTPPNSNLHFLSPLVHFFGRSFAFHLQIVSTFCRFNIIDLLLLLPSAIPTLLFILSISFAFWSRFRSFIFHFFFLLSHSFSIQLFEERDFTKQFD
jgi:hypothetical protein